MLDSINFADTPAASPTPSPTAGRAVPSPTDRTRRELVGTLARVVFRDDSTGSIIATLRPGGETIIGEAADGEIEPRVAYRFAGRWVEHPRHGWQFRFDLVTVDTPVDQRGVVAYLCREVSGCGMTQAVANRLWAAYGADVLAVLRTDSARVARDGHMDGWKAAEACRQLRELERWERTKVDLFALFAGRGFPRSTIRAACDHRLLGVRAAELIRRDPYLMLTRDLPGVGFRRADKLFLELGGNPARLKRQLLAAWSAMRDDNDGHTWHVVGMCRKAILDAVGLHAARFDAAVTLGIRARWLATRVGADGRTWYTERQKAADEATVARELARLMRADVEWQK